MSEEVISGVLPIDRNANPIQVMALGTNVADDVDGVSDNLALPGSTNGRVIRVASTQDVYINFGDNSVTAAAANYLLPAGAEYFQVPDGTSHIAYLQVTAAGRISVTEMV
jgi:hypothetical protein